MEGPDQINPCAICLGGMGAGGGRPSSRPSAPTHSTCTASPPASRTATSSARSAKLSGASCHSCDRHQCHPRSHYHSRCPCLSCSHRSLGDYPPSPWIRSSSTTMSRCGRPLGCQTASDQQGQRPTGQWSSRHTASTQLSPGTRLRQLRRACARQGSRGSRHRGGWRRTTTRTGRPRDGARRQRQHAGEQAFAAEAGYDVRHQHARPDDRLCVVSFSSRARRVTRLARMSDAGKALCVSAVESLKARTGSNIAEGLRTAAEVLDERRYRNGVSSVILLSDGQDNYTTMRRAFGREANYEALVPPSLVRTGSGDRTAPIHTFGFGNDHDAVAMHVISEATGGTFSFIENEAVIQDAFAQCIGGLLSVVVQEARIAIACVHPGVRIGSVRSGLYESRVDLDGRASSVVVGELYADEERRFLLFLVVPRAEETDGHTTLMEVTCSYRDATAGAGVNVMAEDTVVVRPEHVVDVERSVEVEREHVRVEATQNIAAARAAAERGAHQEAVEILENRRRAVAQSEMARGGDPMVVALEIELQEMLRRVSNRQGYARSGRAYMLARMSAHLQQRASSTQLQLQQASVNGFGGGATMAAQQQVSRQAATVSYATPAMLAMLLRSRREREASAKSGQQQPMAEDAEGSGPKVRKQLQPTSLIPLPKFLFEKSS